MRNDRTFIRGCLRDTVVNFLCRKMKKAGIIKSKNSNLQYVIYWRASTETAHLLQSENNGVKSFLEIAKKTRSKEGALKGAQRFIDSQSM